MIWTFFIFALILTLVVQIFSYNPRPYLENGKLNSPIVATFASEQLDPNIGPHNFQNSPHPEFSISSSNPNPASVSLQEILSPQQYARYEYLYHNNEGQSQSNSPIHKINPAPFIHDQDEDSPASSSSDKFVIGRPYNARYPFTPPVTIFRIGVISDLDEKVENVTKPGEIPKMWDAFLNEGSLFVQFNQGNPGLSKVTMEWDKDRIHKIRSGYNYSGRGMELSTLNVFNGHVYSCDDKTGIVFELLLDNSLEVVPVPWSILADGNFTGPEGFKCEWGTVKDRHLWIGGHGISMLNNDNNATLRNHQKFVKKINADGEVTHMDWRSNYDKMAQALDIDFPGYVAHESAGWSDILQKWVFMPRRISKVKYTDEMDSISGSNVVLMADENFDNIQVTRVGDLIPLHGFSSFKWIPGTGDQIIVAVKTVENSTIQESYIMASTLDGTVLLEETKFADQKFEGIEFI